MHCSGLLVAAAAAAAVYAAPPAGSRVLPAPVNQSAWIEPYPYLSGGDFTGPPLQYHPDPLGQYQWGGSVNQSQLQVFFLLPSAVTLTPGTPSSAFSGLDTLVTPGPGGVSNVTVTGPGGLMLDFGCENAAWLEFTSPNLRPADLQALVTMGISEYDAYGIFNLGPKVGTPVAYPGADGAGGDTLYRLELNSGLYEGVRFGWLWVNASLSAPFTITSLRAVAQIKPTNWGGAFSLAGDDTVNRAWWAGAYTVKVNLLSDQFGSILIYRGDRFSWTGDASVAQRTALYALGNFAFVNQNLNFTRDNCNGIESYCLYFVLSVLDYYHATGDAASTAYYSTYVEPKLSHAHDIWGIGAAPALGFYGWDDRLGSGFSNGTCTEAESAYRFLAMRVWKGWADALVEMGQPAQAAQYYGWYNASVAAVRASAPTGGSWYDGLGLFASADAINAGFTTATEQSALISRVMNDSVTICGLSNFNTYFVLDALAAAGDLDRGYATVRRCWEVMVATGATTTWETSSPEWMAFLSEYDEVPAFEDGYTSMAHPWGSGATSWASRWLLGIRPVTPGYAAFVVAPHLPPTTSLQQQQQGNDDAARASAPAPAPGIAGKVPTPAGAIGVNLTGIIPTAGAAAAAGVSVFVPAGLHGSLQLSQLLASRLALGPSTGPLVIQAQVFTVPISNADADVCSAVAAGAAAGGMLSWPRVAVHTLQYPDAVADDDEEAEEEGHGPIHPLTRRRSPVRTVPLPTGCSYIHLTAPTPAPATAPATAVEAESIPNPFPPASYPATLIARDDATAGSWMGTYGSAGYALFAYDGVNQHVASLPAWVSRFEQAFGHAQNGPWPTNGTDLRALQDPRNASAPRKIGQYSVPPAGQNGWDPSYPMDILLQADAEGAVTYQLAVYFVDFDRRGRRQTVVLLDRATFNTIAPHEYLQDFGGGVWLVWQYNRSVRLRLNWLRGDNQVISAIALDLVNATGTRYE